MIVVTQITINNITRDTCILIFIASSIIVISNYMLFQPINEDLIHKLEKNIHFILFFNNKQN